jgi:hypothetical protein
VRQIAVVKVEGMQGAPEMTLRQFVESTWLKLLARGFAILGAPLAGAALGYFLYLGGRVDTVEQYGARLNAIETSISDLGGSVASIRTDTLAMKIDTARIAGMVEALRREALVSYSPLTTLEPLRDAALRPTSQSPVLR